MLWYRISLIFFLGWSVLWEKDRRNYEMRRFVTQKVGFRLDWLEIILSHKSEVFFLLKYENGFSHTDENGFSYTGETKF